MGRSDSDAEEGVYCICRTTDTSRFMIGCDSCNEWYHGDCIRITEEFSKKVKKFCCLICRTKDPSLKTILKGESTKQCGECSNCLRTADCGSCEGCLEGRRCRKRVCKADKKRKEEKRRKEEEEERRRQRAIEEEREQRRREKEKRRREREREERERALREKKRDKYTKDDEYMPPEPVKPLAKRNPRKKVETAAAIRRARRTTDSEQRWSISKEPQQCFGPRCIKQAKVASKYCSDECGMKLAMSRIFEILPARIQAYQKKPAEAELANEKALQKIRIQIIEAEKEEADYRRKKVELDELIRRAKSTEIDDDDDDEPEDQEQIFCVTCGLDFSAKTAIRHMERCYNRYEGQTSYGSAYPTKNDLVDLFCEYYNPSQQTYCKRLKILCPEHFKEPKVSDTEVCGFPHPRRLFDESEVDFCRLAKKKCVNHISWERMKRAQIDMEIVRTRLKREELSEQERIIQMQMKSRGGVLGLLLHETIDHEDDDNDDMDYSPSPSAPKAPISTPKAQKVTCTTAYHGDHDYGFRS